MEQLPGTVRDVLHLMGRGSLLLVNENDAYIWQHSTGDLLGLNLEMARQIIRNEDQSAGVVCRVRALTQFRCGNYLGWRELVGPLGERFDVFGLVM